MARYRTIPVAALVAAALHVASPAVADDVNNAGKTVKEAARTGGHPLRDGAPTFGRTTRDFFQSRTLPPQETRDAHAERTQDQPRAGGPANQRAPRGAERGGC